MFDHFIVTTLKPIRKDVKDQACVCARARASRVSADDESERSKFTTFDLSFCDRGSADNAAKRQP